MNSLTDVYETISAADGELLEKQAEAIKVAEEEDAAGRIMARGFMDELHKLAAPMAYPPGGTGQSTGSGGFGKIQGAGPARGKTPMAEAPRQVNFSKNQGSKVTARAPKPKQTREQAVGHARGIANMAKGVGNFAKKPAAKPPGPPKLALR
jgi:hypothetical protein